MPRPTICAQCGREARTDVRDLCRDCRARDTVWESWWNQGYSAAQIDVLIAEGFTLDQPPTRLERRAIQQRAFQNECHRIASR